MTRTIALVVAAGRGVRLGGEMPKQYLPLGGRPLLRHCLELFAAHPRIDAVRAVIHPDDRALYDAAAAGLDLLEPVAGGATRQDSVRNGLESLVDMVPARVLIHDAARPFIDAPTVTAVLDALDRAPGAIVAVPVADTVKRAAPGDLVATTVDRTGLWRAQTPQAFRYAEIRDAHRRLAGEQLTDDAAVAERAGLEVLLVTGREDNFKVTSREDLARAERRLGRRDDGEGAHAMAFEYRSGSAYDVHRFGPGDHVTVCGVRVPHDAALIGHSDADVGLHAITDALLGAIGDGDIGTHFPPDDPQWKGVDSAVFLKHAADLVSGRGGAIVNVDVTLVCERPKIGPHRPAMRDRVADLLGIDVDRVSVKATTTERLGFTGRREGMAAVATASVRLPAPG